MATIKTMYPPVKKESPILRFLKDQAKARELKVIEAYNNKHKKLS